MPITGSSQRFLNGSRVMQMGAVSICESWDFIGWPDDDGVLSEREGTPSIEGGHAAPGPTKLLPRRSSQKKMHDIYIRTV